MIVGNKYEIEKKISEGTFGSVFQGKNLRTGKLVAIKVEKRNENGINTMKYEANVYNYLKHLDNFIKLRWFGTNETHNFLVIDLLGSSLKSNFVLSNTINNLEIVHHFGKKIVLKLMTLHDNKIIHRDIKPENILLNTDNSFDDIFFIDFSFCKKYIKSNGEHMRKNKITKIIGSTNYVSLNVHKLTEPSRRDDLESIIYVLMYLYFGKLEWQYFTKENNVHEMKKMITYDDNLPECFRKMILYVRSLEFDERPNYFYFINLMQQ